MTIAAGIVCSDGLIICADTEHTAGDFKYQQPKIFPYGDWLLVTGTGTSDYIKMAFDKLCELEQPDVPTQARGVMEQLAREIHADHIFPFHRNRHPYPPELPNLIVGIRCKSGELSLIKTSYTGAILCPQYAVVGAGWPLFEYWTKYFFSYKQTMAATKQFCTFILREIKESAYGCGGSTHLVEMPQSLSGPKVFSWGTDAGILAGFPSSVVSILVACANLTQSDEGFKSLLAQFEIQVKQLRECYKNLPSYGGGRDLPPFQKPPS